MHLGCGMAAVIELKPLGEFWQVLYAGHVIACAVAREGAVSAAAGLLRRQLQDPAARAELTCVGLELAELLAAPPMEPNWKRKGPPIPIEFFARAELYLQTELVPDDEAELIDAYRAALQAEDYSRALEQLVQLGERQDCTNPFWQALAGLIDAVWPTQWMVERRAKGQREAKIATIRQRARGSEPGARRTHE
jgi:hypothetical protein